MKTIDAMVGEFFTDGGSPIRSQQQFWQIVGFEATQSCVDEEEGGTSCFDNEEGTMNNDLGDIFNNDNNDSLDHNNDISDNNKHNDNNSTDVEKNDTDADTIVEGEREEGMCIPKCVSILHCADSECAKKGQLLHGSRCITCKERINCGHLGKEQLRTANISYAMMTMTTFKAVIALNVANAGHTD